MLCPWQEGRCARTKDCLTAATVLQLRHLHSNHQLLRLQADGSNGSVSGLPEITTSLSTPASSLFLPPSRFSLFFIFLDLLPLLLLPCQTSLFIAHPPLSPLSRVSPEVCWRDCVSIQTSKTLSSISTETTSVRVATPAPLPR